jgi:hypothetical protein
MARSSQYRCDRGDDGDRDMEESMFHVDG